MATRRRRLRREVYGYHGTTKDVAREIKRNGFRASVNTYDWLGDGVYFWQDAPSRAREWATTRFKEAAAVLGARMQLSDACMDLLDIDWWHLLDRAYTLLVNEAAHSRMPLPQQGSSKAHRLDCAVVNYCTELARSEGVEIPAVRAAFIEGTPVFPNSAIYNRAHVQIAVIDVTIIEDIFVV